MKIKKSKISYALVFLGILFFMVSAFKNPSWFKLSCNERIQTDSTSNVRFQECIDQNTPIMTEYIVTLDSLDLVLLTLTENDTLLKDNTDLLSKAIIEISDSIKKPVNIQLSQGLLAENFFKNFAVKFCFISNSDKELSSKTNEFGNLKTAIDKKLKSDSLSKWEKLIKKIEEKTALPKKLKNKEDSSKIDSYIKDTISLRKEFNDAELTLLKYKSQKNNLEKEIEMLSSTIGKNKKEIESGIQKEYNSKFNLNEKTYNTVFNNFQNKVVLLNELKNKNVALLIEKKKLTSKLDGSKSMYENAAMKFDELIKADTTPVSQINFSFNNHLYSFYVINSAKYDIKIHNNSSKTNRTLKDQWDILLKKGVKPVAIMNGGMYNPDFSPTGFMITDDEEGKNKIKSPLNEKEGTGNFFMKPNGVFVADNNNNYTVLSRDAFKNNKELNQPNYKNIKYATQSGPMLIDNGKKNKLFTAGSQNLNIRNGIGTSSKKFPKYVFIAISVDKVNFYDLAFLFQNVFKCDNALYLDGVISKLYFKDPKSKKNTLPDDTQPLGPMISVCEKKSK